MMMAVMLVVVAKKIVKVDEGMEIAIEVVSVGRVVILWCAMEMALVVESAGRMMVIMEVVLLALGKRLQRQPNRSFPCMTHSGANSGHFETSIIHFLMSEGVSEVSEQAKE